MKYRTATLADSSLLAKLNHQLIRDEGHNNPMTLSELEARMKGWLSENYTAVIFEDGETVAYALFREQAEAIHLRQLFVVRHRRRMGVGRQSVQILRSQIWPPNRRLTVDVLTSNKTAVAFWRVVGYSDYSLTLEILADKNAGA